MKSPMLKVLVLTALVIALAVPQAQAQNWEPVHGETQLRELMSNTVFEGTLSGGQKAVSEYNADGTGELRAWGDVFPREWKVEGDDQICLLIDRVWKCYRLERNTDAGNEYRSTNLGSGESVVFTISPQGRTDLGAATGEAGAPAAPSADELAAQLSNPTAPVMTIGNNFEYITFQGDLPGAGDQSAFRYLFQTAFPFKLAGGGSLFFRPGIPVLFNDPVPDGQGGFSSEGTDLGDTGFDFSYGKTSRSGLLWGGGVAGTIPTATNEKLGADLWGLGPELLLGVVGKWGVVGGVLSHQWDIGGSGSGEIDRTSLNYFYAYSLGGGWQIAAGPTISYDHTRASNDSWTVPLGIGLARTMILGGRPWKFQVQYWNYVESPDAFSAEHQFRLSISPVVSAFWNKDK